MRSLVRRTRDLLGEAVEAYRGTAHEAALRAALDRFEAPLRVAIAGRVKSGKSTLLNALVGERLAPTDAGECTRVVTWYRHGHTCRVELTPRHPGAAPVSVPFRREEHGLDVDLGARDPASVDHLDVTWPSPLLQQLTLVDTPGIGSLSEGLANRAWELVGGDEDEATPVDAVVYLLRHLHPSDVEFLQAFHDGEVAQPHPVNAIGVLSRADEVGVARLDAMDTARRVADRLSADPTVRRLVQGVLPLAGLLAETATTLTEREFSQLRRVAALPPHELDELLLSADRFLDRRPDLGVTSLERAALAGRFGVFGIRLAAELLRQGAVTTATELARELATRSGLRDFEQVMRSVFLDRRDLLKSRSALLALSRLVADEPVPGGARLAASVEEVLAGAHEFQELRLLAAIRSGSVTGRPAVLAELERVVGGLGSPPTVRLGLDPDAGRHVVRQAAAAALASWQRRAENPMSGHDLAVAARVAVRSCEGILAGLDDRR